jgi:hypothetical protein
LQELQYRCALPVVSDLVADRQTGTTPPQEVHAMSIRPLYTPEELDRLHDRARAEAHALRQQAIADFWRGADGLLASAVTHAERSATRLASRLRRRAGARGTAVTDCP